MLRSLSLYCRPELLTTIRCYVRKAGNPGMNKLFKNFKETADMVEDPEGFGDIESDFMDTHKSHKEYEHESKIHRQFIQRKIVGNKYFKHNEPNFLTYAEKEQMKLLHSRDSEEWNPEHLSESFPATVETISKILKGKWVAATSKRIERHDQSVMKNWSLFNKGEYDDLNPTLKEHLAKFAERKPEDLKNLSTIVRPKREFPKLRVTEFSSIISSSMKFKKTAQPHIEDGLEYPQLSSNMDENPTLLSSSSKLFNNNKSLNKQHPTQPPESPTAPLPPPPPLHPSAMEDETYLLAKIYNKEPMRFQDLIRRNPEIEQNYKELLLHQVENPQGTGTVKLNSTEDHTVLGVSKFQTKEVEINARDMINLSSTIREKIHIPRRLWKKGFSYKLNDCYYDDDGEFLYRVPGMTGNKLK